MGTTNRHRTCGRKPRLVGENHDNRSRWVDNVPDEGFCQMNARIWSAMGVTATEHQELWFMHDDAPTHFSIAVRNHQNAAFPMRWIRSDGPIAWPPRSLDLNRLNFFSWDHLKPLVYETPVGSGKNFTIQIVVASADITSSPDLFQRLTPDIVRVKGMSIVTSLREGEKVTSEICVNILRRSKVYGFLLGLHKEFVVRDAVPSVKYLIARISVATERISDIAGIFQNIRNSMQRHCQIFQTTSGRNIEHLL
ncbi:uncharacterized protein TNCV_1305501 [Trichonephila clavipes]|nr:uncharacterized protein TNCV_1305501 [Trichonephila clavipes]